MVHGLAEGFLALLEYVRVNVDNVDGKVAVRLAFTGMVEGAECNIASTPGTTLALPGLSEATNATSQRRCTFIDMESFIRSYFDAMDENTSLTGGHGQGAGQFGPTCEKTREPRDSFSSVGT